MNPYPKPRPHALDVRDKRAALKAKDRREIAKVKNRSGGHCEVSVGFFLCNRPAMPGTHHLIFGSGRKNVGDSILASRRLDVRKTCHSEITQNILVPVPGCDRERAATIRYQRRT